MVFAMFSGRTDLLTNGHSLPDYRMRPAPFF